MASSYQHGMREIRRGGLGRQVCRGYVSFHKPILHVDRHDWLGVSDDNADVWFESLLIKLLRTDLHLPNHVIMHDGNLGVHAERSDCLVLRLDELEVDSMAGKGHKFAFAQPLVIVILLSALNHFK